MAESVVTRSILKRFPGAYREQYAEFAALAVCGLLILSMLGVLAHLAGVLMSSDEMMQTTASAQNTTAAKAAPALSIAQWHLFGNSEASSRAAQNASSTTSSLLLRGTVAETDPTAGIAMIADSTGAQRPYRVGQEVIEGVRVTAVFPGRVILSRQGVEETLYLPKPTDIISTTAPMRPVNGTSTSATDSSAWPHNGNVPASSDTSKDVTKGRQLRLQNAVDLLKHMQILPVMENGKMVGVRLASGTDAALVNQLGLDASDVITAVNGVSLDSLVRGQQLMDNLKNAAQVRVTVRRKGKPVELTMDLN